MTAMMNTAVLRIYGAELIGLSGRLFEAELNGDAKDRAIITRHMREAIAKLNEWQACHLDASTPETMNAEAA